MIKRSLKHKVFLLFGGFTLLLSFLYMGLALLVAYIVEDELIYRLLEDEKNFLVTTYYQSNQIVSPRSPYFQIYWRKGESYLGMSDTLEKALSDSPDSREIFTRDNKTHYHLLPFQLTNQKEGVLVLNATPFLVVTSASYNIILVSLVLIVILVLLSLYAAYRLSRSIVLPIESLSDQIRQNYLKKDAVTDSSVSFSTSSIENEIGYLSQTLESAMSQLSAALTREFHFTRDLSHELRTPLTIMKNQIAIELTKSQSESSTGLVVIENEVDKCKRIVDVLLALARKESVELETINLRALLEESVLMLRQVHPEFEVTIGVPDEKVVVGNQLLCQLLMINLMENAIHYGKKLSLTIDLEGEQLKFKNKIRSALVTSHSNSIGQGLLLVERICEKLNWHACHTTSNGNFIITISNMR